MKNRFFPTDKMKVIGKSWTLSEKFLFPAIEKIGVCIQVSEILQNSRW